MYSPELTARRPAGNSATSVWAQIVQRVAILKAASDPSHKGKQLPNVSGPEYFGFANPQVAQMIQVRPRAWLFLMAAALESVRSAHFLVAGDIRACALAAGIR